MKRKAVVFLISDFIDTGYEKVLAVTNKRHDVVALELSDPREKEIPPVGYLSVEDPETGERITVNTSTPGWRQSYSRLQQEDAERRKKMFRSMNLDRINLDVSKSYVEPLIAFFRSRAQRFR